MKLNNNNNNEFLILFIIICNFIWKILDGKRTDHHQHTDTHIYIASLVSEFDVEISQWIFD